MSISLDPKNNIENLIAKNQVKRFSLYILVVLTVFIILGLLPVIKIDISGQSRGFVRSQTENVPLMSMVSGKITDLYLQNNLTVHKGDTLVVITQENLLTEKQTTQNLTEEVTDLLQDLALVVQDKNYNLKTQTIRQEWYSYQTKYSELVSKQEQAKIAHDRHKNLFDKGVISLADYEKVSYDYTFAKQALVSFDKSQKSQWQSRIQDLTERSKNLKGTLEKIDVESNNYIITAPVSGTIESFSGLQKGSFLIASQPVAILSPNENLIIETFVSPKDIGFIRKNQDVKFQLDAFNYNQWGLAQGKVIDIDQNVTIQDNQTFFKVRCGIDHTEMKLKNGYTAEISKGMTLTSRFIITRRSLFDLLFDKVDDWLNPKIITE